MKKTYIPAKPRSKKLALASSARSSISSTSGLSSEQQASLTNLANWWKLDANGNLYTEMNVYSTGEVSAYGLGDASGGGGGVDLLQLWTDYDSTRDNWAVKAGLLVPFYNDTTSRLAALESGTQISLSVTGTGNGVGSITKSGSVLTVTKVNFAELDATGKILSSQLPSYVDDVLEYTGLAAFPATGESGKIYIAIDTNLTYRWSGTGYALISASIALGETSSTAYRGDRGKIAYDHSQISGNPHLTAFAQIESKPTTIAGYGITDSYTKTEINSSLALKLDKSVFDDLFVKVNKGTEAAPVWAIEAKYNFYSVGELSAYGFSTEGSGGGSFDRLDAWADYDSTKSGWVLSALLGNELNTRVGNLESGSALTFNTTGTGNAVTSISKAGTVITANKDLTFSLDNHLHTGVYEPVFAKNTAFNKNFGTTAGTVAEGNHTHSYLPLNGGTLTGNLAIENSSSFAQLYLRGNQANAINYVLRNAIYGVSNSGFEIYDETNAVSVLAIQQNGNVGIGQPSPAYKLDVAGTGRFTDTVTAPTFIGALSGNASTATNAANADLLDGYDSSQISVASSVVVRDGYANIRATGVRYNRNTAKLSTVGWYRVFVSDFSNVYGSSVILNVDTTYNYIANSSLSFAINVAYNGAISIVQLSGYKYSELISKIRVNWDNVSLLAIDVYYSLSSVNAVSVSGSGAGYFQTPTLVSTTTGFFTEFTTVNGTKSHIGFTGDLTGNASSATKLQTSRTIAGVSFDGTASIDIPFANLTAKPTTLSGYGITDAPNLTGTGAYGTWGINVTGNAATATNLSSARTFSATGDAAGSVSSDLSAGFSISLTLANSGVTAGTYRSVTVDAKGRVTSGTNPTTLAGYGITDAAPISHSNISGEDTIHHTHGNKTYLNSINQSMATTADVSFNSLTAGSKAKAPVFDLGNLWTIEAVGTEIQIKYDGILKQKMLNDGSFAAVGELTAYVAGSSGYSEFLPLSGGTITGSMTVNTNLSVGGNLAVTGDLGLATQALSLKGNALTYNGNGILYNGLSSITLSNGWTIEATATNLYIKKDGVTKGTF